MNHRRLLVVVLFLAIFSFDLARTTDIDFWWHLKTGELIAQTRTIPSTDPFSYTAAGQRWTVHEWLWEVLVFIAYGNGGYVTLVLISALLVTGTFAILYRLIRRLGANEILSGALILWAAALALPNLGVRPRELTHLFLAVYLSRLLSYREGFIRPGQLWPLPVLMALWVNLHGAFVLGIGVLGLCAAGTTLESWWSRERSPRYLWLVLLLTVGAASINPRGPWMLYYPFGYFLEERNPSFDIVTEFQSPNFHDPMSMVFAAGLLLFLVLGVRRQRVNIVEPLLAVAFTAQALVSDRQTSAAAEVMAPLLALVLCERFGWARELPPVRLPRRLNAVNWILLGCLVVAGIAYAATPRVQQHLQFGVEPTTESLPVTGADFIERTQLPGPVFNNQPWGGYLIYRWYPQRRVFIDGRIDMYGPAVTHEYLQVATIKPEWRTVLDKYRVQTVLIEKNSALSVLLLADGGWERVFQGMAEDVFIRRADRQL